MEGMISRIDHVSIAVRDYEKARAFFSTLFGAVPGASGADAATKYFWQIFSMGDMTRLELVHPTGPGSFLDGFLSDRQGGVHHITLQTPDIAEVRRCLDANGIPYFGYNEYRDSYWKELFIHPKHAFGVLIQISEFYPDDWLAGTVKMAGNKRWLVEKGEEGIRLNLSHPGGGQVQLSLNTEEVTRLIADLQAVENCKAGGETLEP
jgi:methylmalonyl-CoA/ethylmalonyl-CoA epimerase